VAFARDREKRDDEQHGYRHVEPALGGAKSRRSGESRRANVSRSRKNLMVAARLPGGAKGCACRISGHDKGNITLVALSFMCTRPSEIIECHEREIPH